MQQKEIQSLKSRVEKLESQLEITTQLLLRYGFADPRLTTHNFKILDRLDFLESKD